MNDIQTTAAPQQRRSLVTKIADRFGVDPGKMLTTLKATCFKTGQPVTDEQMMSLLIVADQYGLNPFTKELFAFPDKGGITPVVSVDGWARIINDHPMFNGMTFSFADDGSSCTCTMHRKDRDHPIEITEYRAECERGTQPWKSHPRRMLRHKAMIQTARMAFGFSGVYDEDEAQRISEGNVYQPEPSSAQRVRDALRTTRPDADGVIDIQSRDVGTVGDHEPPEAPPLDDAGQPTGELPEDPYATIPTLPAWDLKRYTGAIEKAKDRDTAAVILDEARTALAEDEHATLTATYRLKFAD